MDFHWRDSYAQSAPADWRGLVIEASGTGRPSLRVETCHPRCIRLSIDDAPLVWTRIEDDYWGFERLRASNATPVGAIPALPFSLVDEVAAAGGEAERDQHWAREYAGMLRDSDASPISGGRWHLGHFGVRFGERVLSLELVQRLTQQPGHEYVEWDFGDEVDPILLRDMSPPDSGRVKAWRKRVRDGSLPPVLLYWVSGFATYVVLDGHDRLLAAALEGAPASALSLETVREETADEATKAAVLEQVSRSLAAADRERARPIGERLARVRRLMDVERANELLLKIFVPTQYSGPTTAYPLEGGAGRWANEVHAELVARAVTDSGMLEGLDLKGTDAC